MARTGPPAYAWDWFSRQRLLWRACRGRLADAPAPLAGRYAAVDARADVVALLRHDYLTEPHVREVVEEVITETAFLSHTDARFADLGVRNPPRGMRWWWTAVTGEELDSPTPCQHPRPGIQLSLDDAVADDASRVMDEVHEGYGG